jgi:assimilatory nitrate reductase catalytic subunit
VRAALSRLQLLVVADNVASNDTVSLAHIALPATAWGEKDGTVTNSERCISRQRAFLRPPGRARPDWWMLSQVARRLGHGQAFAYRCAADIFEEHARLSGFENGGSRAFDISGRSGLSREAFDQLMPFQWPCRAGEGPTERLLGDGRFFTPDRKARFVAIAEPRLSAAVSRARPFVLNTGRIRDQWHTMTRTGLSPRLTAHLSEPFAEIHPDDAASMGLVQGALARVSTTYGAAVVRVLVNRGQQRGTLFVPIHWSAENSSGGRIGALVQPATDPHSGQPEAKATPARIAPLAVSHYGLALSRQPVRRSGLAYWAAARTSFGHILHFALDTPGGGWLPWQHTMLPEGDTVTFADAAAGAYRAAVLRDGRLEAMIFVGPTPTLPAPEWLKSQFERPVIPVAERRALLAGRPIQGGIEEGPVVCVCFQVGSARIAAAISEGNSTVEKIGSRLGAGTNCGSCVPELHRLLAAKAPTPKSAAESAHEPA